MDALPTGDRRRQGGNGSVRRAAVGARQSACARRSKGEIWRYRHATPSGPVPYHTVSRCSALPRPFRSTLCAPIHRARGWTSRTQRDGCGGRSAGKLRVCITGGAALSSTVQHFFDDIGIPVIEGCSPLPHLCRGWPPHLLVAACSRTCTPLAVQCSHTHARTHACTHAHSLTHTDTHARAHTRRLCGAAPPARWCRLRCRRCHALHAALAGMARRRLDVPCNMQHDAWQTACNMTFCFGSSFQRSNATLATVRHPYRGTGMA